MAQACCNHREGVVRQGVEIASLGARRLFYRCLGKADKVRSLTERLAACHARCAYVGHFSVHSSLKAALEFERLGDFASAAAWRGRVAEHYSHKARMFDILSWSSTRYNYLAAEQYDLASRDYEKAGNFADALQTLDSLNRATGHILSSDWYKLARDFDDDEVFLARRDRLKLQLRGSQQAGE